jgi:hypothetical protein
MADPRLTATGAEDQLQKTATSSSDSFLSPTSTVVSPVDSQLTPEATGLSEKSDFAKVKEYGLASVGTADSSILEKGPEAPVYVDEDGPERYNAPPETAKDLVTEVLQVEDDPSLNPWTFRTWFLGMWSRF